MRQRVELPKTDYPLRAHDYLPDRPKLDRQHDDGDEQRDREQEPVLLEIGQGDQGDQHRGNDVAQGNRGEHQGCGQQQDDGADKTLRRLVRGGPARIDRLFKFLQRWHGSLHQGGEVPRWQGTGGDDAWEDRGVTRATSLYPAIAPANIPVDKATISRLPALVETRRAELLLSSRPRALFVDVSRSERLPALEKSRAPEGVFKEIFYHRRHIRFLPRLRFRPTNHHRRRTHVARCNLSWRSRGSHY
jgi:hypothetical protein